MRFDRTKYCDCQSCPFNEHNRVWGEGPTGEAEVVWIGEAPGKNEDEVGRPFVGAAGAKFDDAISEAGFDRNRSHVMNVLACRPPDNDINTKDAQIAIKKCRPGFQAELEYVKAKTSKPRQLIVSMGNTPLAAMGINSKITKVRGTPFTGDDQIVFPVFHPAYLLYASKQRPVWEFDLKKAREIYENGFYEDPENFNIYPTLDDLRKIPRDKLLACDIETTSVDKETGEIVCIAIMWSATEGLVFPFLKKGGGHYWNAKEFREAEEILRDILKTRPTMWQNVLFDVPWLEHHGFPVENIRHDTILAHHAIDPELPHDLGFIASIYAESTAWKEEYRETTRAILKKSDDEVRTYCGRDGTILHQILPNLLKDIEEEDVMETYERELRLVRPLIRLSNTGILLDKKRLRDWKRELDVKHEKAVNTAYRRFGLNPNDEADRAKLSFSKPEDMRWVLYGEAPSKCRRAKKILKETEEKDLSKDTKKYAEAVATASLLDVETLYVPKDVKVPLTDKGKLKKVDKQAIMKLMVACDERADLISKFKRPTKEHLQEVAAIKKAKRAYLAYREEAQLRKTISTYTKFEPGVDGRVRSKFAIHLVDTGRFSSSGPNLQNQPEESRQIFIAPPGMVWISRDYSQLELRILAIMSQDPGSLAVFASAKPDPHTENAKILWGREAVNDPRWKKLRNGAKRYRFLRNYGGSIQSAFEKVAMEFPDLGLTLNRVRAADRAYAAARPKEIEFQEQTMKEAVRNRKVRNGFGRQRVFRGSLHAIRREGVNYPIQSTAADIINEAFIKMDRLLEDLESKMVLQIHDQLVFECPIEEVPLVFHLSKLVMEAPVEFINVKGKHIFPTDATIGCRWSELESPEQWNLRHQQLDFDQGRADALRRVDLSGQILAPA